MKSQETHTPRKKRSLLFRLFKWLFLTVFLGILLIAGSIAGLLYHYSRDLPQLNKIEDYRPYLVTEVFDSNGEKIGEFWKEYRYLTPISEIPKTLINGFVASEDERFFEHHGVDYISIFRAFLNNLTSKNRQGGSTITQQLTKNILLNPDPTMERKVKEALLATKIEKNFSKDQILYLYLNHIYLGNRAYGVQAAAKNYFHKELKDLNLAETAMIIGLSKGPSYYDPIKHPDRAKSRQSYVLDRMVERKFITAEQANQAKQTPLNLFETRTDKDFNLEHIPYFTEHLRKHLIDKYGEDGLYRGGWKIYTTIDTKMQLEGERAISQGVRNVSRHFGYPYRGPLKSFNSDDEIETFNREIHLDLVKTQENLDRAKHRKLEDLLGLPTPLVPHRYYPAVILGGSKRAGFQVQVGNEKGFVAPETMTWSGAAGDRLKRGDVVQVQIYRKTEKTVSSKKGRKSPVPPPSLPSEEEGPASSRTAGQLTFALDQDPLLQGALFSYEPFSGEIKVIVGGTSFQKSEYNRAIQALRQPGSTIKPLIYAAALDKGYTPNTTIMDSPLVYKESGGKTWEPKNYGGGFSNAAITFRSALVQSKNVVTVRILMDIGTHYATAFMRKCGFASDIKKFYSMALGSSEVTLYEISRAYGVFATGGVLPELHFIRKIVDPSGKVVEEVIPPDPSKFIITWDPGKTSSNPEENPPGATSKKGEKASGEAQIPETQQSPESQNSLENPWPETLPQHPKRYGKKGGKIERVPWDEMPFRADLMQQGEEVAKKDQLNLSDYEKKILYGNYIPAGHVITPRTAATMVSVLQDVVKYGTGTPVLPLKKPAAGKTGTTNGATDAWFIGFTPTLVTGVWIGHDERIKTIGHNATGGHVAAPIWLSFMQEATKKYPTKSFKLPAWLDLTQYQTPMEIVKGDSEAIEGTGDGPSSENKGKGTSGAEFFSTDPL